MVNTIVLMPIGIETMVFTEVKGRGPSCPRGGGHAICSPLAGAGTKQVYSVRGMSTLAAIASVQA